MGKIGRYIYGVIDSNREEVFDLGQIGALEKAYQVRCPAELTKDGIFLGRAYTIGFRDVAAVVNDAEIVDYSQLPKDALAQLLLWHQEVIEKIMAAHSVVPMRLGTFAESEGQVRQILAGGYKIIQEMFERAQNRTEIDVVVTLADFNSFLQEVSDQQEIREVKQEVLAKQGGVTPADQMKVGVLVKQHLDKRKQEYAMRISAELSGIAESAKTHDLMDDKMILNTAFLVDARKQESFLHRIDHLDDEFEEKLNFRCVGPLPPYSFCTLQVKKAKFEEVQWARKELGLVSDFVTAEDIKKAHRKSALSRHPDKNPKAPGIEKKFDDMTKAYEILLDYYRASSQKEQTNGCRFSEQALEKGTVLVTKVE